MFALNSVFFLMVIIIMSIFFIYSVNNLPLGPPLNERNPPEISWQAWLIMDNNNQKNDDNNDRIKFEEEILLNPDGVAAAPKRRIVPKSIFTVPPRIDVEIEDLPPCDSKTQGCVQIIKINESEQIEFMLNQLIGTGPGVDYDTIFNPSDSEPTRVDLFNGGLAEETFVNDNPVENNNGSEEEEEEEIDMAFILAPVLKNNADKTITDNNSKLTGKRKDHEEEQEDLIEDELKKLPNSAAAASTTTTEDATTTTTIDSTTTRTTTEEEELTTTTESSSLSTEAEETTTLIITTTDSPLAPSTTEAEQLIETTTTTTTTTLPKATETTTYHPPMMATTYHPEIDLQAISNKKIRTLVKFPEENLSPRSYPSAAAAAADTGNLVRFPDIDTKVQEESSGHHTRNVDQQTHVGGGGHHYFNEIATPTSSFADQYRHYPSITEENKFAHINNNNNNNNRRIKWPNLEEYRLYRWTI